MYTLGVLFCDNYSMCCYLHHYFLLNLIGMNSDLLKSSHTCTWLLCKDVDLTSMYLDWDSALDLILVCETVGLCCSTSYIREEYQNNEPRCFRCINIYHQLNDLTIMPDQCVIFVNVNIGSRVEKVKKFVKAISRPTRSDLAPIRVKEPIRFEHAKMIFDRFVFIFLPIGQPQIISICIL